MKNLINKVVKSKIHTEEFYKIYRTMMILDKLGLEKDSRILIDRYLSEEDLNINNLIDDLYYCQRRELISYITKNKEYVWIDMFIEGLKINFEIENDGKVNVYTIDLEEAGVAYKIKKIRDTLKDKK